MTPYHLPPVMYFVEALVPFNLQLDQAVAVAVRSNELAAASGFFELSYNGAKSNEQAVFTNGRRWSIHLHGSLHPC